MMSTLLIANIVCFLLQTVCDLIFKGAFSDLLSLSVYGLEHWQLYQLVTFQFLHSGILHLLMNLIGLYFFGRAMEDMLGSRGLLKLYLISGTVGGLLQMGLGFLWPHRFGGEVMGASAGVFGLIAAFAASRPNQPITMLLFLVLPVTFPAKYFIAGEAAIALWGMIAPPDGIAHAAHLGGMLAGAFLIFKGGGLLREWCWPGLPGFRRKPRVVIEPPPRTWRAAARPRRAEDTPPAEFMSREVDPILDKISAHGIHSLTEEERRILESAHSRMSRR